MRDEHAGRLGYDVDAIFRDLRARQVASGRQYVRRRPQLVDDQAALDGSSGNRENKGSDE